MLKTYRKITTIQAEQFDGSDEMINKYPDLYCSVHQGTYYIMTMEGQLELHIGDWIATGVNGEHWVIADNVFKQTYVEVEE